ncbi:histidine kinase [Rhodospirillum rubrum ATCC 11170]|uniref:C4-dicarboxylate transport sensor protein DctB n=1 Tax=Rhodospirillum rubrum (strain ATCC 11170 / ATH 1.1.1 / DSM 467 / LMG 4362 / NCIMB 8255 / S1) TaxID=269796 RepID=Q2RUF8_RHORT|nr:ATP-binding protein [Rhodospirillum rubrum]ABC22237.1 histidine kinase [Rhodospirillum rubrum ATCC 11170]
MTTQALSPGRASRWPRLGWRHWAALALALLVLFGLDRLSQAGAQSWTLSHARDAARAAWTSRAAVLQSEIEKQRSLPLVLASDPDLGRALESRDPAHIAALNEKFETLAAGTRAGVIYLLDLGGVAIAASNWRAADSFVGSDYGFRPYFRLALDERATEHFALGTVSHRPGLYIARRIDGARGPLGVLVVKVEFETIEAQWQGFAEPTFVTDAQGVVIITSLPSWRFLAEIPKSAEESARIRASLPFEKAPLTPLPIRRADAVGTVVVALPTSRADRANERPFVLEAGPQPATAWTLHVLAPARVPAAVAAAARTFALMLSTGVICGSGLWYARSLRRARERGRQRAARIELEERVSERTAELRSANDRLLTEIDERRRAEAALQDLQDELVQARKLAVLGQIAASVAHEINQPVAAIRTFADNARIFLARAQPEGADHNLQTIATLTERIGAITGELRAFARKSPSRVEPVSLRSAIDGALLLVGHRLRQQAVTLGVDIAEGDLTVAAERVRLEQVLVNLLQNAVEALAGRRDGTIRIAAIADRARVTVTVCDNGPGLSPDVVGSLFMPFTTTKPTGLGLGLVIAKDIIAEFGGSFTGENAASGGARFTITLARPQ